MKLVGCHGVTESARFSRERCVNFYVTPGASGGIADASLIDAWRHQRSCHTVPPSLSSQRWDARISSSGGFQTRNTNNQKRASSSNSAKFTRLADNDIAARCWVYSLLSLLDDLPSDTQQETWQRKTKENTGEPTWLTVVFVFVVCAWKVLPLSIWVTWSKESLAAFHATDMEKKES